MSEFFRIQVKKELLHDRARFRIRLTCLEALMRGIRTFLIAILITTIGSPWNAQTPNLPALCVEFLYLVVFCRES